MSRADVVSYLGVLLQLRFDKIDCRSMSLVLT